MNPVHRIARHLLGLPRQRFASESSTRWLPLSDGVRLATTFIRPLGVRAERIPSVLIRTPFSSRRGGEPTRVLARLIAEHGFAVVLQECRGRYDSEGRFTPFEHEARDGEETLDWIAEQPWHSAPLGLVGFGYAGFAAWAALCRRPEVVGALVVGFNTRVPYRFLYPGGALGLEGALQLGVGMGDREVPAARRLDVERGVAFRPVRSADRVTLRRVDAFREWVDHPCRDGYWFAAEPELPAAPPPALLIAGWYDLFLGAQLEDYAALREAARRNGSAPPELVVGPWGSGRPARRGMRVRGGGPLGAALRETLSFLDRKLLDGTKRPAPVRVFVHAANVWRDFSSWPPPDAEERIFYLRSSGRANGLFGDGKLSAEPAAGREASDHFLYDPEDPVPTLGGFRIDRGGPVDQRAVEARGDVLCYTTELLREDLALAGPVRLVLYAASNAPDTDFTAKLVDVAPNGCAMNLCEGIVRARRQGEGGDSDWLEPGTPRRFEIDLWATSCRFRRGGRIRLEVSSSNFPRFDRNPNTRAEPETADCGKFVAASQTVFHDGEHPSRLVLCVLTRSFRSASPHRSDRTKGARRWIYRRAP